MRILFALPGFHRVNRGAEVALISIASELANAGDTVTLIGSGEPHEAAPYRFLHAAIMPREQFENWPSIPVLRSAYCYEDLTFVPGLLRLYSPADYDITITCNFPFTNWTLRRPALGGHRPPHVYVTENGDWPAFANESEYRWFGCEGLVCTNPDFYERNKHRWRCRLIPNGVDGSRFHPGPPVRETFGLPQGRLVVLMVSALIPTKRVEAGIDAVSRIPDAHLVVAGDGPLREIVETAAARLLPNRFSRLSVAPEQMPGLYRSANVFLHLSKEEAFGNVYLEALACGLPVVAPDTPRVRWITGDHEFLVAADDPISIARQIELARDTGITRQQERRERAATWSWKRIASQYREFLQEIVTTSTHPKAERP